MLLRLCLSYETKASQKERKRRVCVLYVVQYTSILNKLPRAIYSSACVCVAPKLCIRTPGLFKYIPCAKTLLIMGLLVIFAVDEIEKESVPIKGPNTHGGLLLYMRNSYSPLFFFYIHCLYKTRISRREREKTKRGHSHTDSFFYFNEDVKA